MAGHQWLQVANEEDPEPVAAVADVKELPDEEVELILSRMVQGGYGSEEDIIRLGWTERERERIVSSHIPLVARYHDWPLNYSHCCPLMSYLG